MEQDKKGNYYDVEVIKAEWEVVEGYSNGYNIKRHKVTGEYAVFENDEILDDTITTDITCAEKMLEEYYTPDEEDYE